MGHMSGDYRVPGSQELQAALFLPDELPLVRSRLVPASRMISLARIRLGKSTVEPEHLKGSILSKSTQVKKDSRNYVLG
jgi:hypothetical protein